jgi:DNA-binding NtrC family response regulator
MPSESVSFHGMIGQSATMRALRRRIERVAPTDATVLILGERGTGKELVARALQRGSGRRAGPFVTINCGALPRELLASELFGHERGAFTGALERKRGLVTEAAGGTLFLDEIGDLSLEAQAMLLRFLQEREVRPLGSTRTVTVDVRVLAATNRNLDEAIARREFRADLYDRLAEIVIRVPPLGDRRGDIPALIEHFLALAAERHGVAVPTVTPGARRTLRGYEWPGNVRELELSIRRAFVLRESATIDARALGLAVVIASAPSIEARPAAKFSERQAEALRRAWATGAVRRSDLRTWFGVSTETARRDLVELVRAGVLMRRGGGRRTRYVPCEGVPGAET